MEIKAQLVRLRTYVADKQIKRLLGLALLSVAAGFLLVVILPTLDEIRARELELTQSAKSISLEGPTPSKGNRSEGHDVRAFYGSFPEHRPESSWLTAIGEEAQAANLGVTRGSHGWSELADSVLQRYEVNLAVAGSYPDLRRFLLTLLHKMPYATVDHLSIQRSDSNSTLVSAQLALVVYMRKSL